MASQLRVNLLVGSLRSGSVNRRLALALSRMLADEVQIAFIDIGVLPHYNEDAEVDPVQAVVDFRETCASADAFLFVTPEYNRSVPGVLKNAIDQGSRPKTANVWKGKPAAVIGASLGVLGSSMAQQHLRNILAAVDVPVMGHPEAYIHAKPGLLLDDGVITDESVTRFLHDWCVSFVKWAHLFQQQPR